MSANTIDAQLLKKMFLAAAKNLEDKKEWINELNVFPVPDGDTGTNMTLTILSAAKEVAVLENPTIEDLSRAISSGSLRGARGNSGVILSQLFRGFTKEIKKVEIIDIHVLARAMQRGTETAYKAVMKPKEGTILTVARGMSEKALEIADTAQNLESFIEEVIKEGDSVLNQTPQMLPVLKQAGVVDSGGQGLMQVLKGAVDAFLGKEVEWNLTDTTPKSDNVSNVPTKAEIDTAHIKYGYCTEFIIMLEKEFDENIELEFKGYLESIGDSIVVVSDDEIVKVHVHTNDPGLAIQKALTYGSLTKMKIDNMREEHQERVIKDAEKLAKEQLEKQKEISLKEAGFIAVSIGEGLNEIFRGLSVDYIIEGGQTMNPSTEDMLNAIEKVHAENVYILPNNKNIILAAEQAKKLLKDKNVIVIPSKTIPQGIAALIAYVPGDTVENNTNSMTEGMNNVKTGQVTYAVRDTSLDGKEIHEGDIMGIGDKGILSVGKEISDTALEMIENMVDDDTALISIYYGSDVSQEDADKFLKAVKQKYSDYDVDLQVGGQPIYYYLISVE